MALTTYKILRRLDNAEVLHDALGGTAQTMTVYVQVGAENAHSTDHALRQAGAKLEHSDGGDFVAVAMRAWKEEHITVETTPRVRIGA